MKTQRMSRTGLWRHRDFKRLWAGQTVSMSGSLVSNISIPFAAIIELDATPFDIAALRVGQVAPAFLVGLIVGAFADRVRRRPHDRKRCDPCPVAVARSSGGAVRLAEHLAAGGSLGRHQRVQRD